MSRVLASTKEPKYYFYVSYYCNYLYYSKHVALLPELNYVIYKLNCSEPKEKNWKWVNFCVAKMVLYELQVFMGRCNISK